MGEQGTVSPTQALRTQSGASPRGTLVILMRPVAFSGFRAISASFVTPTHRIYYGQEIAMRYEENTYSNIFQSANACGDARAYWEVFGTASGEARDCRDDYGDRSV